MYLALVVVAVLFVFAWPARRENQFCLSVRDGRVLVVRGRAPTGFVSDVGDIAARDGVREATIRAVNTERGGRLLFSGDLSDGTQQRLHVMLRPFPEGRPGVHEVDRRVGTPSENDERPNVRAT